jgi:glutamine synthetase
MNAYRLSIMAQPVSLSVEVSRKYESLSIPDKYTLVEYVWIDGAGGLRSKSRCISSSSVRDENIAIPEWSFDGSSTGQATGKDSEVLLLPIKAYMDPFRGNNNPMVLCETCYPDEKQTPHPSNTRRAFMDILENVKDSEPWFGIEQEYVLFRGDHGAPLAWGNGSPAPQGPYYCSVGSENAIGRRIAEAHFRACLDAGIKMSGINAEVMPGQWEYQVGICAGDEIDDVWMARYILLRVAEDFGVSVSFDPKPVKGDWNGSGAHTNFSTKQMRAEGGYSAIVDVVKKLEANHASHMKVYGQGNERRLTGAHETAPIDKFSWGVADRGASVRIPRQVFLEQKGYLEDRRPAANCDPYLVCAKILETIL